MICKILLAAFAMIILSVSCAMLYFQYDFIRGKARAEKLWEKRIIGHIDDIGTTGSLVVTPLVERDSGVEGLKEESGVSYLIKTDTTVILFDTGFNHEKESPSPLLHNMRCLGVDLDDIDVIVISHNHMDHVGGLRYQFKKSFSLDRVQVPLGKKHIYVPVPMDYPGQNPIHAENPHKIAEGVATTGVIHDHLYLMGAVSEQALAINVKGKGIVLIVGCGHQTLPKILMVSQKLFNGPLFGVIGGLHYPVARLKSDITLFGVPIQNYLGTGDLPWRPITMEQVGRNIAVLQSYRPRYMALSPHDSCTLSIAAFRKAFGAVYHDIKTGVPLVVQ